jgi:hypothetical protein
MSAARRYGVGVRRRVGVLLAVPLAVAAGCSGDDGGDSAGEVTAVADELCPAFDDWRERDVWPPSLTDLSPMPVAALETYLDGRQERIERLVAAAEASDLELAADLSEVRRLHDDLRKGWGGDGSILLDEALENEVEIELLTGRATPVISSAVVASVSPLCDDEPEGWEPVGAGEASELPDAETTVMAVDLDDESLLLLLPDGDEVATPLDDVIRFQNTDRRPLDGAVLVNALVDAGEGEVVDRVLTGDSAADLGVATPETELWTCARWAADDVPGDTIGFARWREPSVWVAATAELTSGEVTELDVPAARVSTRVCPLVTDDGTVIAVDHRLERYPAAGGGPDLVAEVPGCALLDPIVQPGTEAITFLARCTNVYDEGYYRVAPGADPERIVDGVMGSASWSDDGSTLVVAAFDGAEFAGIRTVTIGDGNDDGNVALVSDSRSLWPIFAP